MTKLIVIAGPTGIGKSKVASNIALTHNLKVINADASQMHYWMEIGTANIDEYSEGITYELYNFFEPLYEFSIKDYQDLARKRVEKENAIIVCGGSGLYIDALCLDLDLKSSKRSKDYSAYSNEELYLELDKLNHELAIKTHPNNRKRVERYLETTQNGELVSKKPVEVYDILFINLDMDRNVLYQRINDRCDLMFEQGWIDEAKRLERKGFDLSLIKEIGYSTIGKFLHGEIALEECIDKIKQDTRHYAKRQLTWFRGSTKKYKNYYTFNPLTDIDKINEKVNEFLSNE